MVVAGCGGGSGAGGERADRVQDGGEVVSPGPAGWHPQDPAAAGAGQSGGDREESPAAGVGGLHGLVGERESGEPASEVVRECGDHGPGAVGANLPEGKCAIACSVRSRIASSI